jgi:hypothetical protein
MTSGENLIDFFFMTPLSQMLEPPRFPGRFKAVLKRGGNELGERVSNDEMEALSIQPHAVCPAWNYTIHTRPGPSKNDHLVFC